MAKSGKAAKGKAGPYLAAAVICEKILIEQDGVTSAMRIVDIINLSSDQAPPPRGTIIGVPLALLIMLKSGDLRGDKEILIRLANPSGIIEDIGNILVTFVGPSEGGVNSQIPILALKWDTEGVYWYEIVMDNTIMTRIPLRVNVTRQSEPAPKASAESAGGLVPKRKRRV